jgi:hypothetical protein
MELSICYCANHRAEEADATTRFGPGCSVMNAAICGLSSYHSITVRDRLLRQGLSRPLSQSWRR